MSDTGAPPSGAMSRRSLPAALLVPWLLLAGCSGSDDSPTEPGGSPISAQAQAFVASVAKAVPELVQATVAVLPGVAQNGSYNPATGWWTVPVDLPIGSRATMELRFEDSVGNLLTLWHPENATVTKERGTAAAIGGSIEVDLSLTGTDLASANVSTLGTGTASAQGASGPFEAGGIAVPKSSGYPIGGTLTVTVEGSRVRVDYNTSRYVTATYSVSGTTFQFRIDLMQGTVDPG